MRNPFNRTRKNTTAGKIRLNKGMDATVAVAGHCNAVTASESAEGKLLVMGRESTFSNEVIDYAIDMARRMSFEILALNSAPLSCDSLNLFSSSRSSLCREFQSLSEKNAMAFRHAAEANGIPFTHVVKFDEPEQALSSVQREYGTIEFVISDAWPLSTMGHVAQGDRTWNEVLVYSVI